MVIMLKYVCGGVLLFVSATTLLALAIFTFGLVFPDISAGGFSAALLLGMRVVFAVSIPLACGWVGWELLSKG
jgi:hypothetical protein